MPDLTRHIGQRTSELPTVSLVAHTQRPTEVTVIKYASECANLKSRACWTAHTSMPLERIPTDALREALGFTFAMCIAESLEPVRVFVADNALEDNETDQIHLRSRFEAAGEALACEKYARGRFDANGVVTITLADILGFIE
ncbi:MAG: hypothetical protein AB7U61_01315 [Methylocystis sp.]